MGYSRHCGGGGAPSDYVFLALPPPPPVSLCPQGKLPPRTRLPELNLPRWRGEGGLSHSPPPPNTVKKYFRFCFCHTIFLHIVLT
jgi:hypothetical protein